MINLLRWLVRIAFLGALVLGIMARFLNVHMMLGWIVALGLATIAVFALFRARTPFAGIAILWAAFTVFVGLKQSHWMLESNHWAIQVLHVALGIGAVGMAEALAGAVSRAENVRK